MIVTFLICLVAFLVFDFVILVLVIIIEGLFLELMKIENLLVKVSEIHVVLNRGLVVKSDIFPDVGIEVDLVSHELFLRLIDLGDLVFIFL
jgi:hypothetical protein